MARISLLIPAIVALALTGCKTDNQAGDAIKSVSNSVGDTAGHALGGAVSLVNVDLSNVLNNLALDLHVDRANIPINAQIPITLAANVCGVSINILSVSTGGSPNCTAKTTSPDLAQAVQQQLAANGSVGGGAQTSTGAGTTSPGTSGATTTGTTTSGTTTSGTTTGTTATAPGTTTATPRPDPTPPTPQ